MKQTFFYLEDIENYKNILIVEKYIKGGLGVRHIDLFNKALLTKWLWKIGFPETGLWKNVLESKYGFGG